LIKLVVQVVAVGDDNYGRVFQLGTTHKLTRIERHEQALARALRVPYHANLVVTLGRRGLDSPLEGVTHSVKLVVTGDDLGEAEAGLAEYREIKKEIQ